MKSLPRNLTCLSLLLFVFAVPLAAQEPVLDEESKERLAWLEKFAGKWEVKHEGEVGPQEVEGSGMMNSMMLGEYWLMNKIEMEVMGTSVTGIQTIGYDPKKKKYIGTWVDSMTNYLWHYEGEVDDSGNKLVLEAKGPDMTDPEKTALYRDAYEFKSDDHIIATSSVQGEDGTWTTFMSGNAYRLKDDE